MLLADRTTLKDTQETRKNLPGIPLDQLISAGVGRHRSHLDRTPRERTPESHDGLSQLAHPIEAARALSHLNSLRGSMPRSE